MRDNFVMYVHCDEAESITLEVFVEFSNLGERAFAYIPDLATEFFIDLEPDDSLVAIKRNIESITKSVYQEC